MKILGYTYTIVEDGNVESIGAFGRCLVQSKKIQVATDLDPQQRLSTLLHEIIETLNYHLDLSIAHPNIMALEAGLYEVLTDNGVDLSPLF